MMMLQHDPMRMNLVFAPLFSIIDALESISQDVHAHHYVGTERWWKRVLSLYQAKRIQITLQ